MIRNVDPGKLHGVLFAPASKSYAQRALLAASLASGTSDLKNLGSCKDTDALTEVLRNLGVVIDSGKVTGPLSYNSSKENDTYESGLATRLLIPVLALSSMPLRIIGRGSILSRRMDFLVEPLRNLGVTLSLTDGCLPAIVKGPLRPSSLTLDCRESSQFLSGLLFALPLLSSDSKITAQNLNSRPYIDMTLETLSRFGISIRSENDTFFVPGNQKYRPTTYEVEGDWSAISTIAVAPGCKTIRGLNTDSKQADRAILKVLDITGVRYQQLGSDIKIFDTTPSSFRFDAKDCPDLFPALAVLAVRAKDGVSEIAGTDRLFNKESNRLLSIAGEFSKMGVSVDISIPNLLRIQGGQRIHAATVDSHNDHRIAMALASLALLAEDGRTTITGAESVNKSYRNFWNDFNSLYRYE